MLLRRIIPALLIRDGGLVKTIRFSKERYIGDPINAVKIFNEKEVDELCLLDIGATIEGRAPAYDEINEIVSEAFMPVGYGGGIRTMDHIEQLFKIGVDKVIMNTAAFENEMLVKEASSVFGNQSIVISIDIKKDMWGRYNVFTRSGKSKQKIDMITAVKKMQDLGAGEIILNNIDRDGTMQGYDLDPIYKLSRAIEIPLVALGGAATIDDFIAAINHGAAAVSAGSMFVFQGVHKGVLISYITSDTLENKLLKI
jgi:imidazole glycerol-phosphate synthase subunit HisF